LPLPLYKKRLRQRGFKQSLELARPIANRFNIAIDVQSVKRVRETQSQTGLDRKQRRKNIRGAFDLVEPLTRISHQGARRSRRDLDSQRILRRSGITVCIPD